MPLGGIAIPTIEEKDSHERLRTRIEAEIRKAFEGEGEEARVYVEQTFDNSVIVKDWEQSRYFEVPYVDMEGELVLGTPKEVDKVYVEVKKSKHEMTGPIVMKNASKQIAYAAVLVPNEVDHDGDILSPERVEKAAHEWMLAYRNIDLQHTLNNVAHPVESYILPMDMHVGKFKLPKGTWILASQVQDKQTWERIEKGELTGYSVMGIRRTTLDDASMKSQDMVLKKTLLRDLGDDWVACAVSIVDEPAVPKAKFFAIKSKEDMGVFGKIKEMLSSKKEQKLEEEEQETINTSTPINDKQEDESSMGEKNDQLEALEVTVKSLEEKLDMLIEASNKSTEPETTPGEGEGTPEGTPEGGEDIEALKSRIADLEKQVAKKSAGSQAIKGQEGIETKPTRDQGNRDLFGRVRR